LQIVHRCPDHIISGIDALLFTGCIIHDGPHKAEWLTFANDRLKLEASAHGGQFVLNDESADWEIHMTILDIMRYCGLRNGYVILATLKNID